MLDSAVTVMVELPVGVSDAAEIMRSTSHVAAHDVGKIEWRIPDGKPEADKMKVSVIPSGIFRLTVVVIRPPCSTETPPLPPRVGVAGTLAPCPSTPSGSMSDTHTAITMPIPRATPNKRLARLEMVVDIFLPSPFHVPSHPVGTPLRGMSNLQTKSSQGS
ncbi:MAG TPA: hypothetical protein VJM77_06790 [Nitrospiria bacterium]|nr:hypothetical protein [Nitrospiria bacterium]